MALQTRAQAWFEVHPAFEHPWTSLDLRPLLAELFALGQGLDAQARGAAMFHLALAGGLAHRAIELARGHGARTVALGGGCFANRLLAARLIEALQHEGLRVMQAHGAGCGDAGLALGQAWVAACTVSNEPTCGADVTRRDFAPALVGV